MPAERSPRRLSSEGKDRDRNRRQRLQDALPLVTLPNSLAKPEVKDANKTYDSKAKELGEITSPTGVPRSRSFSQHDDRDTADHDGRRSGRRLTSEHGRWKDPKDEDRTTRRKVGSDLNEKKEHGRWKDPKDEDRTTHRKVGSDLNETKEHGRWKDPKDEDRTTHRKVGSDLNEKKDRPEARSGDSRAWRHDRFFEMDKNADPPTKKRRQFREEKLPQESKPENHAATEPSKDIQHLNSARNVDTREERDRFHRPSERNDYGRTFVKARSFVNRERGERIDMPPRDRFNGGEYDGRYMGRDMFGGRQGFRSSGGRVEKWKHDMYYEANSSPTKTEEDPVAKVEALLSL